MGPVLYPTQSMQSPTHFLTAIVLYKLIQLLLPAAPFWVWAVITIPLAVLLHFVLDCLAGVTYHLPDPQWHDRFWVAYHVIFVYVGTLVLFIVFFIPFWWVMLASVIPDIIDWYTLRPLFKRGPVVHPWIDRLRECCFKWVPNWRDRKWTVALEIVADGLFLAAALLI
jgi:hypothetical protein